MMSESERRLAESLIRTGRLSAVDLDGCLRQKRDGEGLIDTLVRQATLGTAELESALGELRPEQAPARDDDLLADVVRRLERYTLLGELGRGATGCVFLAYDGKLKRSVALKVIPTPGAQDAERTRRELEIAASLEHAGIAAIYDAHPLDHYFIIAMQYIEGRQMGQARLSARQALTAVAQAARAVHHAHQKGVVHRDLKPENMMVTPDDRVYVLDFGVARAMERCSAATRTGTIVGTPMYMSPEQIEGGRVAPARTSTRSGPRSTRCSPGARRSRRAPSCRC
jgi:serine/threonine protein kinase